MYDLKTNLGKLSSIAANPKAQLEAYLQKGKIVIGCFPVYTPEVLVDAAGMVPMGLWGAQTEFTLSKSYLPPFACPIMHANMEMGLNGKYNGLKGVIIPVMCDTLRNTSQDFKKGVPSIESIILTLPQNRKISASLEYLVSEYADVKARLEAIAGKPITDDAIAASIDVYNTHNHTIANFLRLANSHLDIITPTVRHAVMKSGLFMTKEEHTSILEEINTQLEQLPPYQFKGKRIILTGITAEPDELLDIIHKQDMAVVGDDLAQETRQYRTDIPAEGTAIQRLAKQWLLRDDPMAHDETIRRGEVLLKLVQENKADGVILCLMKFCDPEEYEYPIFMQALKEKGIPVLSIDVDQQPAAYDQARTRIQTFADIL